MSPGRVLVVQSDLDDRDLIESWLEAEGYEVLGCPGPTRPDYTCVGSRTQRCPLAEEADVVVLDLVLESDIAMEGTPAEMLLQYYTWAGKKVIALRGEGGPSLADERDVVFWPWPPERESVVGAVRAFAKQVVAPGES
jgi:CheY-like chemotaxis protein